MITQQFKIVCNAPSAWLDPSLPATTHTVGDSLRCNGSETIEATSTFHAAREFQRAGWYISDDSRTYCGIHAETARRLDQIAREKARSS